MIICIQQFDLFCRSVNEICYIKNSDDHKGFLGQWQQYFRKLGQSYFKQILNSYIAVSSVRFSWESTPLTWLKL